MNLVVVKHNLRKYANKKQAKVLQSFFKTGPGEYAQGDIFLGVRMAILRSLAKQYQGLSSRETLELLKSPIHEDRLLSLLILILKYHKADSSGREKIFKAYLQYSKYINNWDLVDISAKHIVGDFLADKDRRVLYKLARSNSLWERRIAVVATFYFIQKRDFKDTLRIARILIADSQDLIHKAAGWMLREVGKRDRICEEIFLRKYCLIMPRTMLRYAIERFPLPARQAYLRGAYSGKPL